MAGTKDQAAEAGGRRKGWGEVLMALTRPPCFVGLLSFECDEQTEPRMTAATPGDGANREATTSSTSSRSPRVLKSSTITETWGDSGQEELLSTCA